MAGLSWKMGETRQGHAEARKDTGAALEHPDTEDVPVRRRKADGCDTTNRHPRKREIRLFFPPLAPGTDGLMAPGARNGDDVAQFDITPAVGPADPFELDHHVMDGVPLPSLSSSFGPTIESSLSTKT